jgi:hypothetical protein
MQPGPVRPGALTGVVYRRLPEGACQGLAPADCRVPVAGAEIRVTATSTRLAPLTLRARTGSNGRFSVGELVTGIEGGTEYQVSVELADGTRAFFPGDGSTFAVQPVPLGGGKTVDLGDLVLAAPRVPTGSGVVGGWVGDETGLPLEGATVRVYLRPGQGEDPWARVTTDAEGAFLIEGLGPGEAVWLSAEVEGWIPIYHPRATLWTEAEPVIASTAARLEPVRFSLAASATGGPGVRAVRVHRTTEAVSPFAPRRQPGLEGAFVHLLLDGAGDGTPPVAGGVTGANGTVLFTGLPAGAYQIRVDRPGFSPVTRHPDGEGDALRVSDDGEGRTIEMTAHPFRPEAGPPVPTTMPILISGLANAPNPFRPRTSIRYTLSAPARVTIQVFDYRGRLVATLVRGTQEPAGSRSLEWSGRDDEGNRVSAGVYFYRVQAGGEAISRKMVLLP